MNYLRFSVKQFSFGTLLVLFFSFSFTNVSFGQEDRELEEKIEAYEKRKEEHRKTRKEYKREKDRQAEKEKAERTLHVPKSGIHLWAMNSVGLGDTYRTTGLDVGVGYRLNKSVLAFNAGVRLYTASWDAYHPLSLEYKYYAKNESGSGYFGLKGIYKPQLAAYAVEPFVGYRLPAFKHIHWTMAIGFEVMYDNVLTPYESGLYNSGYFPDSSFLPKALDLRMETTRDDRSVYGMLKLKVGLEF